MDTRYGFQEGTGNPDLKGPEADPDETEAGDEAAEMAAEMANLEDAKEEFQEAWGKLTSRIRELRSSLLRQTERMEEAEAEALVDHEVDRLAESLKDREDLEILKHLLPDRAGAQTAREKFTKVIRIGMVLPYWSKDNFFYRTRSWVKKAIDGIDADEDELRERLEQIAPELAEEDELEAAA